MVDKKRRRRTKAEIDALKGAIYRLLEQDNPATVRSLFYQMVSAGLIEKTANEYSNVTVRLSGVMREGGVLPFEWVTDLTRWMRKPRTFKSGIDSVEYLVNSYRQPLWADQDVYVELWTEKDAVAGVLMSVTEPWDVPLMVARGFSSKTFLHEAAQTIKAVGKPTYLYYFGDWDPSGVSGERHIEKKLRQWAPGAEVHFERVAVTQEQIKRFGLPTRFPKKTDSRSGTWKSGGNVEVDALPPRELRRLATDCIERHIDPHVLKQTKLQEQAAREGLVELARLAPGVFAKRGT